MVTRSNLAPIVEDVRKQYVKYRKAGKTRTATIELIRENYAQELGDEDDRLAVLIGLALSLCKKKELCESVAVETLSEIQRIRQGRTLDDVTYTYLVEIENCLRDEAVYGKEAWYKRTSPYVPDWRIGDTFAHTLTYPTSKALGIYGWFIILYKVGEYVDEFEAHRQLMYVALCPPDKQPSCHNDLERLSFLQMMRIGEKTEYLAQITIRNQKDENAYCLSKIGYFPNIALPNDYSDENPLTAMPLFGRLRETDPWPSYEDQICRLYRKYGRIS